MVLDDRKPSAYNEMLGRMSVNPFQLAKSRIPPPERAAKRQRTNDTSEPPDNSNAAVTNSPNDDTNHDPSHKPRRSKEEVPDSDADSDAEEVTPDASGPPLQTDVEQTAPPVRSDKEAIEEYETLRAADGALLSELRERLGRTHWVKGKSSIYVDAFNLALQVVLEEESHLFDGKELQVFEQWNNLPYEAQYLYVRLFLRKTAAWHRVNRLRYYSDIGDLGTSTRELFISRKLPQTSGESQSNPGELAPPEGTTLGDTFTFADSSDEHITTLDEASTLLMLDELKGIAKEAKVRGKNKRELLKALCRTSGKQTALAFPNLNRTDTEDSVQSEASDGREESPQKDDSQNRDEHFTKKILTETGPCIRLSLAPFKLFERVHLVFYRSSEWTEKSLTTIILARISRRNFPPYIVSRSANIFSSRQLLLEFEASLRTQFRVDNILEFNGTPGKEDLQVLIDLFDEVYPRWKQLLLEEQQKESNIYTDGEGAYLRRLSPAWVYTRIVHKASFVLGTGKFKHHLREHGILTELLGQRLFHASRRGSWYQRKALLEEHYMAALTPSSGRTPEAQKKHWKRIALETCEQGLQDNLVHLMYHYDLQKRLTKLEKALRIPKRLQHDFGHARLAKPIERTFEGVRIEKPSVAPTTTSSSSTAAAVPSLRRTSNDAASSTTAPLRRGGAKTVWLDPAVDGHAECSVEEMCLSHYRAQGWKGYHSEGGIVRTLFALLFYDVLFAYVPNVFQTPFQTCPLDLHTDAFYPARMSEINARLAEIGNGGAERLIRAVWAAHAESRTCVVGLDWDFELEDLCEIARCFAGGALATLCKVVAQEYAERGGGVPDLFLWDVSRSEEEGKVCFAEVKSENDRLSDTQRLWIHVLTAAGIRVELCNAVAKEVRVMQ